MFHQYWCLISTALADNNWQTNAHCVTLPWTMVEQIWTETVIEGEVEHQQSMLQMENGQCQHGLLTGMFTAQSLQQLQQAMTEAQPLCQCTTNYTSCFGFA